MDRDRQRCDANGQWDARERALTVLCYLIDAFGAKREPAYWTAAGRAALPGLHILIGHVLKRMSGGGPHEPVGDGSESTAGLLPAVVQLQDNNFQTHRTIRAAMAASKGEWVVAVRENPPSLHRKRALVESLLRVRYAVRALFRSQFCTFWRRIMSKRDARIPIAVVAVGGFLQQSPAHACIQLKIQ